LAVPVLLLIGWFVLLVVGRRGRHRPPAVQPVRAGRRERGADRQRDPNTWDLLVFGRTQGLE
jgi:hypothetical protein